MIDDFLEVFLEDDQLWAAGGAAEIRALLEKNIDARGRLNGRQILDHFSKSGVPTTAARGAMDRFVTKRRAKLGGTSSPGRPSPPRPGPGKASPAPARPASSVAKPPAAPDPSRQRGIGVVSASQAAERSGLTTTPPRAAPPPPNPGTLPWGDKAGPDEPTAAFAAPSEFEDEATQVEAVPTEPPAPSPPPRPALSPREQAAVRPAIRPAASTSPPASSAPPRAAAGAQPELTPLPQPEITPLPTEPAGAGAPPQEGAAREVSNPGRRSASEIRGAPVAAAAQVSSPGRPSPAPPAAKKAEATLPPELAAALGTNRAEEERKAAEAEAKAKAAAKAKAEAEAANNMHRQARDPSKGRLPVDNGVLLSVVGAVLAAGALAFAGTKPAPAQAPFSSGPQGLACVDARANAEELFCTVDVAALDVDQRLLRKKADATRAAAEEAGFRGVWFFRKDTGRVWHVPTQRRLRQARPAAAPPEPEADEAEEDVDDIVRELQAPSEATSAGERGASPSRSEGEPSSSSTSQPPGDRASSPRSSRKTVE